MKLGQFAISTDEGVLSLRHKARQLVVSLGGDPVESTRFAAAVSQLGRDALELSDSFEVEVIFRSEGRAPGLWLRFVAPRVAEARVISALFDEVESSPGELRVRPRIRHGIEHPDPQWLTRTRDLLKEKSRAELMAELRKQNEQLQKHRDELEATVAERTRDLRAATTAAERASAAKGDFLSHMSHELRTPLNGVLGHTQILLRAAGTTPEQRKSLQAIESCGQHLLALINDVLDLAKIEAGRLELCASDVDLHALLDGACSITEPRATAKGVKLVQERARDVPRAIRADGTKLRQVLVNLMGNSAKFTERGRIVVRVGLSAPERLRIDVEDTGIGMTPDELAALFQPFKQAEGGKTRGGTGLGLAITRRVVDAMGGFIDVTSEKGVGTTFRLELPLERADEALLHADPRGKWSTEGVRLVNPGGSALRALVVDDNAVNRDVLDGILSGAGVAVAHASDGASALEAMRRTVYDVVIMDLKMPGMGGDEAIRIIRKDGALSSSKVIAMTASVETDLMARLTREGFDDALPKPFEASALIELVARLVGVVPLQPTTPRREAPAAPAPLGELEGETASALVQEIREALEVGDLGGLVETGGRLAQTSGPVAAWGERLRLLAGDFDFEGLTRLSEELEGQATKAE